MRTFHVLAVLFSFLTLTLGGFARETSALEPLTTVPASVEIEPDNVTALSGRVTDPSGAVVPGATVRLKDTSTGRVLSTTSDRVGEFRFNSVQTGNYEMDVRHPSFAPYAEESVRLAPGKAQDVQVILQLSSVVQQVTVTAKAPAGEGAIETSPANSLEVLEIREVRESAAKDLGEALANLDGVWKVRKAGIANDVVLRGFQQGNIDVLIDGMRIYESCPSQMDPSAYHVDFAELETVDVVKGPYDFRNQGSLGGTVNVIARKPASRIEVRPNLATGSFGFYNPSFVVSGSKSLLHALAGYSYRRGDTFTTGSGRRFTDYANYTTSGANHPAFDSHTGWTRLGFDLSRRQALELTYAHQSDGVTLYPTLRMDALYNLTDRLNANWSLRDLSGAVKAVRAQAYFTQISQWMTDQYRTSAAMTPLGYSMGTLSGTRTLGGRVEAEMSDMIVGVELYDRGWTGFNRMRQPMTSNYNVQSVLPDVRMIVGGAYTQFSHTFGKLFVTASGRVDAGNSEALNQGVNTDLFWAYHNTRSTTATDANPSGSLKFSYLLPKGLELFVGAGSSVRLPDPLERYYGLKRMGTDWVGNPSLQPVRNNEVDLGLIIRTRYVSLRPTVFYSKVSDFVAVTDQAKVNPVMGIMNSYARSYQGVDARIRGGELSYSVGFTRSLLLSGGLSYTRGTQDAKPSVGMPGGNIAEIPPLKSRASLRYGTNVFFAELNGLAAGRQDHVNTLLNESTTPGYAVFGIKSGIHRKGWNLSAGIDNIANRFYYEHLSFVRDPDRIGVRIPEPGRSFYVNLSVSVFE